MLHFLDRAACDSPFEIGRMVIHNMLSTEVTGITGGTQEDQVILWVGGHGGGGCCSAGVALVYGEALGRSQASRHDGDKCYQAADTGSSAGDGCFLSFGSCKREVSARSSNDEEFSSKDLAPVVFDLENTVM